MNLKILWPGKTRNKELRELQDYYLRRICQLEPCQLIETKLSKGMEEKFREKILEIEAKDLEKYFKDDYIICLFQGGKEMTSVDFARFIEERSSSSIRAVTFVVGGFLGLKDRLIRKADFLLSLSKMTFSHELSRIILLEQIYRSLTIRKGKKYAK